MKTAVENKKGLKNSTDTLCCFVFSFESNKHYLGKGFTLITLLLSGITSICPSRSYCMCFEGIVIWSNVSKMSYFMLNLLKDIKSLPDLMLLINLHFSVQNHLINVCILLINGNQAVKVQQYMTSKCYKMCFFILYSSS